MNLGAVEISGVVVRFAINENMIWINMADMFKIEAGDPEWAVSAANMAADAKRRYPKEAEIFLDKFPFVVKSGKVSERWNWHYRIDTNLAMLGLNQENCRMLDQKIHIPIRKIVERGSSFLTPQ